MMMAYIVYHIEIYLAIIMPVDRKMFCPELLQLVRSQSTIENGMFANNICIMKWANISGQGHVKKKTIRTPYLNQYFWILNGMQCRTYAQSHAQFNQTIGLCIFNGAWRIHFFFLQQNKIVIFGITTKTIEAIDFYAFSIILCWRAKRTTIMTFATDFFFFLLLLFLVFIG